MMRTMFRAARSAGLLVAAALAAGPTLGVGTASAGAAATRVVKTATLKAKPGNKTARVQLTVKGTAATLQLAYRRSDGSFRTVARRKLPAPFAAGSSGVRLTLDNTGETFSTNGGQGYVGWSGPDGSAAFSNYFGWSLQKASIELF